MDELGDWHKEVFGDLDARAKESVTKGDLDTVIQAIWGLERRLNEQRTQDMRWLAFRNRALIRIYDAVVVVGAAVAAIGGYLAAQSAGYHGFLMWVCVVGFSAYLTWTLNAQKPKPPEG